MKNPLNINGYIVKDLLYESSKSRIYSAGKKHSAEQFIIKQLNSPTPDSEEIVRFIEEYEIAKSLESVSGLGTYQLVEERGTYYIVMDRFGGIPLSQYLSSKQLELEEALKIGLQIALLLSEIHQQNVIHKDLNPSNILWDQKSGTVRIIDFGMACRLSKELDSVDAQLNFEGTLEYIPPEQTGRMNMEVDFRADLYSLGITLYQLITHKLPFEGQHAAELVYNHIAKIPLPLQNVNPGVPLAVSEVVMKLMAKNPDERYQTAAGLAADLTTCLKHIGQGKSHFNFTTGSEDFSPIFRLSTKIIGREKELGILENIFENIRNNSSETVWILGSSGVGKTALIKLLQQTVFRRDGLFLSGHHDRFKKDVPLHGVSLALKELCLDLLAREKSELAEWKKNFLHTLGPNGKILTDLVPELEKIIGKQPELQPLNPKENQDRFSMIFRNFIKTVTRQSKPVVLFLDDIQWADPQTLKILWDLIKHSISNLLIICASREDEGEDSSINTILQEISRLKKITTVTLDNLSVYEVAQYTAETLNCSVIETENLAQVIFEKTSGNALFVRELLKTLYNSGLIKINSKKKRWEWQISQIKKTDIADNAAEMLEKRIEKLPPETLEALKVAACIGGSFDLQTLAAILNKSTRDTSSILIEAINFGLVFTLSNRILISSDRNMDQVNIQYRFQHYHIQQRIYSLYPITKRQKTHLQIGKHLLKSLKKDIIKKRLIEIIHHINHGIDLITDSKERIQFAEYNLKAAQKAITSSAYLIARDLLKKGMHLLDDDSWIAHYTLTFNLHTAYAESCYQANMLSQAEKTIDYILKHTSSKPDRVAVIAIRLRQYATMGKAREALNEGKKALSLLGEKINLNPGMPKVLLEIGKAKILQGRRKTANLIDLRVMENSNKKLVARIYSEMGAPAYTLGNDTLYAYLGLRVVNLCLKNGFTPELPYALVAYGMLHSVALGNMKAGYEYGKLAIALNEKHNDLEFRCRVITAYSVLIHHWNHPWSRLTKWFKKGIDAGIHSGDKFYLGHSASNCVIWDPTLNIENKINAHKKYITLIKETGFEDVVDTAEMRLQVLKCLRNLTEHEHSLSDKDFNEVTRVEQMKARNYISGLAMYHLAKAEIMLAHGDPMGAFSHIEKADKFSKALTGLNYTVLMSVLAFHSASQSLRKDKTKAKIKYMRRMSAELSQMKKWAAYNPDNYKHHQYIMQAEQARIKGNYIQAAQWYEMGISTANKNSWHKDEAFFHELTAGFYQERNLPKAAFGYIRHAHYLYSRGGAVVKVAHIENQYPELGKKATRGSHSSGTHASIGSRASSGSSETIDMHSITKVSQAISEEVVLEVLLKKLLQITVENAGAQRGVLILKDKDSLKVQGEFDIAKNHINVLQSIALSKYNDLPHSVINFISNSGQGLVLAEAHFEGRFTNDPYINASKSKSIIAEPIVRQNKIQGIIYLENNLNPGVFTEKRQQLLKILSAQIAISIENSHLFESLEEKIKDRTSDLMKANKKLSKKNVQIRNQKEELEKLNTSKDKMFSIIAHDLRSPFNTILGGTEILAEHLPEYSTKKAMEMARHIHLSGTRVFRLLENLLDWALSQTGGMMFKPDFLNLSELLENVNDVLSENIKIKKIKVSLDVEKNVKVYADEHMLYTILRNLVSNSIKYCHENGKISIRATTNEFETEISVIDNGVGIGKKERKKIFELHEDTSTPGTYKEKGTGLGLILCKDFVEKHGGQIRVDSEVNMGCTFSFTLPNPVK